MEDLEVRWRLLHPCEQRGMLNPMAGTPGNIQRMAENEELLESIQVMVHLMDLPQWVLEGITDAPPEIW